MSYLIDTDVLIDGLNNRRSTIELLERLTTDGVSVSIVTVGVLYEGAFFTPDSTEHLAGVRTFLRGYRVLGLDDATMLRFGQLRAYLRRQGQRLADFDLIIASTALTYDLTLVTRNIRHFQRVPGLQLHSDNSDPNL